MQISENKESIGIGWIIAIIVLVVLLVLGMIIYIGNGVPAKKPTRHVSIEINKAYQTGEFIGEHRQNSYHRDG